MKIRQGFISNSSSSSFILCGVNLDTNDTDALEKFGISQDNLENRNFAIEDDEEFDVRYNSETKQIFIGKIIFETDYLGDGEEIKFEEINKALNSEQIQKIKALGFEPSAWVGETEY